MAYTTINKSTEHMTASIWTGNGTKITTGFSPDLIWFKARNAVSYAGILNAISGYDKYTQSFSTDAETTSTGMMVTDSTGYTPGSVLSSNSYVGWSWKANGTGSANTDGSINSTVSANTTSGFSIVKYTGTGANATVGHGLGVAPKMIIVKNTEATENWLVYHQSLENTSALKLNETSAKGSTQYYWNNTSPTSSTFSLGASSEANTNADVNIAYCFADVTGYSKFGSYTGNGNADGTFVYTGFKPAFFLIKNTDDGTDDWQIMDNKRNGYNPQNNILQPNLSDAEGSSTRVDFLSNGVKINSSSAFINGSGEKIIYMAFAEAPLVGTNNVPCTAR
jgi:hypothetical protein